MSLLDADMLPHLVSIYGPPVVSRDTSAGNIITWPTLRTAGVPCLIRQGTGTEIDEFSQTQRQVAQHTIAFGYDGDGGLEVGDLLVNDRTGIKYRFTGDRPQEGVGGIGDFNIITVREVVTT